MCGSNFVRPRCYKKPLLQTEFFGRTKHVGDSENYVIFFENFRYMHWFPSVAGVCLVGYSYLCVVSIKRGRLNPNLQLQAGMYTTSHITMTDAF